MMDHQAFAQLLGNYGELFGAIAVVATLAYLAVQVRQNKDATLASTHRDVSLGLVEVVDALKDPVLRGITLKIMDSGFQSLERDEQARNLFFPNTYAGVRYAESDLPFIKRDIQ